LALEGGDYDKALIQFTEAQALLGEKAHVADLIRVTQDLRSRPSGPPSFLPTPGRSHNGTSSRGSRSAARSASLRALARERESAPVEPEPPVVVPVGGTLIVTTTPRGLLVQVDETPIDLTPMRVHLKTGTHRVALLDGSRRVYETSVDVKDGATATLLRDLSPEVPLEAAHPATSSFAEAKFAAAGVAPTAVPAGSVAPAAATAPSSPPAPSSFASGPSTSATTHAASSRPESARAAETVAFAAKQGSPSLSRTGVGTGMGGGALVAASSPHSTSPAGTGSLYVTSPGIYGVVWINGRPRGYPPLTVSELSPGPVKVEIRVNGVQKRAASVVVQPSRTQPVELVSARH